MDGESFDAVVQRAAVGASRRGVLRAGVGALAGVALGAIGTALGFAEAEASHFDCRHVGDRCKRATQCCSGICTGKRRRKKCQAHDTSICNPSLNICTTGQEGFCNNNNHNCHCALTTGNAGFCGDYTAGLNNLCRDCSTDMDCQQEFGPGAACVVLQGLCKDSCVDTGNTACLPACP